MVRKFSLVLLLCLFSALACAGAITFPRDSACSNCQITTGPKMITDATEPATPAIGKTVARTQGGRFRAASKAQPSALNLSAKDDLEYTADKVAASGDVSNWNCEEAKTRKVAIPTCQPWSAKGDGSTDDKVAVQSAINAFSDVYLPRGATFLVSGFVDLVNNSHLFGPGTIKGQPGGVTTLVRVRSKSHVLIEDITLNGQGDVATAGNNLDVQGSDDVTIRNVTCKNSYNSCLLIERDRNGDKPSTNVKVLNNVIDTTGVVSTTGHGIAMSTSHDITVKGNTVKNAAESGINVSATNFVEIVGNDVSRTDTKFTTGHGGVRITNGSHDVRVIDNKIRHQSRGVFVSTGSHNVTIHGNTISDSGIQCIFLETVSPATTDIYATVDGNVCTNAGLSSPQEAIRATRVTRVTITNNIITDNQSIPTTTYGILANNGSDNLTVLNNRVTNVRRAPQSLTGRHNADH